MATEDKTKTVTDLWDQTLKSYEQALKTGFKVQEDSTRMWGTLLSQAAATPEWQKKCKTLCDDLVPQAQKNMEANLELADQCGRASIDVLKKAIAAWQPASIQDGQARFLSLWEASVNALRETMAAASQTQARSVESWMALMRKPWEGAAKNA